MMDFRKVTIKDKDTVEKYTKKPYELSCENTFLNLLLWQDEYGATALFCDNNFLVKSSYLGEDIYAIPFGDIKEGMDIILEKTGGKYPVFRAPEGERLETFKKLYGDKYDIKELDGEVDYIYLREDLAELKGKKYHSKRNHISSFSKQFDFTYEEITKDNLSDVKKCADRWYKEHADRFTEELYAEKDGVDMLINNFETLGIKGGAIRVSEDIIAFTFASLINDTTVDTHIEKALYDYQTAYSVINNQFAKHLSLDIKYINREDDLGLEGLRKAKLSYHPSIMLKKFSCTPK